MTDGLRSLTRSVPKAWIDYNGHMNLSYYVMAFDQALDVFLDDEIGAGPSLAASHNQGPFVLQNHVHYLGELLEGDRFYCRYLLLDSDAKRLHFAGVMHREADDTIVCVTEQVMVNVDHKARESVPYPQGVQARIAALQTLHKNVPRPTQVGRSIGLRK